MNITFKMIQEYISRKTACKILKLTGNGEDTISIISCRWDTATAVCLLAMKKSELFNISPEQWPAQIIVSDDTQGGLEIQSHCHNVAVIEADLEMIALYELIQEAYSFYIHFLLTLINMVYQDADYDRLLEHCHVYFNNPLILYNSSFKVLSYTKNDLTNDLLWTETVRNGTLVRLDDPTYAEFSRFLKIAESNSKPIFFKTSYLTFPFYACNLYNGSIPIGLLYIVEKNSALSPADIQLFEQICQILSTALVKKDAGNQSKSIAYTQLITDILEAKITHSSLSGRLRLLKWHLKEHCLILVFTSQDADRTDQQKSRLLESLIQSPLEGRGAIYGNSVVFIVSSTSSQVLSEYNQSWLQNFVRREHLRCGISMPYTDLLLSPVYYRQAVFAADMGEENLCNYKDFQFSHLLNACHQILNMEEYLHPAVKQITAYDEKHGAEYLKTLKVYFNYFQNKVMAAQKLNIHRISLFHRLKKIEDLFGFSFENAEEMLHLQFSIVIHTQSGESS